MIHLVDTQGKLSQTFHVEVRINRRHFRCLHFKTNMREIEREEIEHKWLHVLTTSDREKEKDEEATFIFVNVNRISEATIQTS